jgi:endonuclease/exonuclease/phosphatase family metal-dependent hydrolase
MKKFILFILLFLSCSFPLQNFAQGLLKIDDPIRVMTYNIRFDNPNDGDNIWANRREKVTTLIRFYEADIFCLQEALYNQVQYMDEAFPNFDYYGIGRDDGELGGEFSPIFYNKTRFKIIERGTFWLSEKPWVVGSLGWFAQLPRIVTWIKFMDLSLAREFYVYNTHFDHDSQLARDNSAKLIIKKISELDPDIPVILCGDFNDKPGTTPYNTITDTSNVVFMSDPIHSCKHPPLGSSFTFVGWDFRGMIGNRIDYIFVNQLVDVTYHAIISENRDGVYPSDHLPVLIEMNFKK